MKNKSTLLFGFFTALAIAFSAIPARADGGTAPQDVTDAVNQTTATVKALSPIALSAVAVALVPFGAGMALSFVHKVMSKA